MASFRAPNPRRRPGLGCAPASFIVVSSLTGLAGWLCWLVSRTCRHVAGLHECGLSDRCLVHPRPEKSAILCDATRLGWTGRARFGVRGCLFYSRLAAAAAAAAAVLEHTTRGQAGVTRENRPPELQRRPLEMLVCSILLRSTYSKGGADVLLDALHVRMQCRHPAGATSWVIIRGWRFVTVHFHA
ncbi:hypothetical protein B0T22DRAFT_473123 [Podospora appendiculata]|uniref:Uncharacterized protein n=1 Tax=Podospora appendiculata TaxID=314037 RepID=A0AAE0WZG1_9PEZI|nr:hypothetical protein B0T22DRAFT_473123 [Podospora appendiculata]